MFLFKLKSFNKVFFNFKEHGDNFISSSYNCEINLMNNIIDSVDCNEMSSARSNEAEITQSLKFIKEQNARKLVKPSSKFHIFNNKTILFVLNKCILSSIEHSLRIQ